MRMHGMRTAYYILGEGLVVEPPDLFGAGGQPAAVATQATPPPQVSALTFGRMFGRSCHEAALEDRDGMVKKLTQLGSCMNNDPKSKCPPPSAGFKDDSDIPAGYTYLGQFIAHDVTYDSTGDLLQAGLRPENLRTPQTDLDSLYGGGEDGPTRRPDLYQMNVADPKKNGVYLKTDETASAPSNGLVKSFPNDLPRIGKGDNPKQALIGDPRNDENLALAQTHMAFIHFHNKVVDALWAEEENKDCTAAQIFKLAREQVIRYYQWIILHDFLPKLVRQDVLDCVLDHGVRWFKGGDDLFMPLEFSVAAFRIGHSMVRASYEWNPYRRTAKPGNGAVLLPDLFKQTGFLKDNQDGFGKTDNLKSDWVIDWRHFYDFGPPKNIPPVQDHNKSAKLDTAFNLHLPATGFSDQGIAEGQRALTVRNLLRGFYLGLPTGEEVAQRMGETPLTRREVASGPHEGVLDDPVFWGKTPLWYYILKEAELLGFSSTDGKLDEKKPGNRLGPVGSRIVAETLVTLIKYSPYSIIEDEDWRPVYGRPATDTEPARFEMIDLLNFAGVVDPVAEFIRTNTPYIDLGEGQQAAAGTA